MDDSGRRRWLKTAIFFGAIYFAAGITTGTLAGAAGSSQTQFFWRLSAFIISAVVFAAHVAYERLGRRNTARATAWHASLAIAFGAFALALVPNIYDFRSVSGLRPRMLIALIAWPVLLAAPAFVVALVMAAGLGAVLNRRG